MSSSRRHLPLAAAAPRRRGCCALQTWKVREAVRGRRDRTFLSKITNKDGLHALAVHQLCVDIRRDGWMRQFNAA